MNFSCCRSTSCALSTLVGLLASSLALPALAGSATVFRQFQPGALVLHPTRSTNCAQGLVYDDNSFESGVSIAGESSVDTVMAFDLPEVPSALRQVCLCWTQQEGLAATADFDLLIYGDDGLAHTPGTLVAGLGGLRAENVPLFPQVAFYQLDLAALGLSLPYDRVFIGPSWDSDAQPTLRLCGDENGPAFQSSLFSLDQGSSWNDLGGFFPDLKALGVRAEVGAGGEPFDCQANETTLCLNQGRFEVRVQWTKRDATTGPGQVLPFGSDDSGLLYFFNPTNWEMLIKVLDGCPVNGHFWVFFAAVTNVQFEVTVTDSQTGTIKRYTNPQGQSADAVTDTSAFEGCPGT